MKFTNTYLFRCANNPYIRFAKPWDTYLTLPLSVPLSEWLCTTRITPNLVSLLSLLISFVAGALFYIGDTRCLILGAVTFQVSYILDCADGYIARKKNLATKLGHWIDHTFDEVKKPVLIIGLLLGESRLNGVNDWEWIAGLLYLFSRILVKTDNTVKAPPLASGNRLQATGAARMPLSRRQQWLFEHFGVVTLFTSIEAQAIAFVLGPLVGYPSVGFLVSALLSIVWFFYVDGFRYWRRQIQTNHN